MKKLNKMKKYRKNIKAISSNTKKYRKIIKINQMIKKQGINNYNNNMIQHNKI